MTEDVLVPRITASVNQHFDAVKGAYRLFLEGQHIDMADLEKWAELRVTGPRITKQNKKWLVDIDLNIMCSAKPTINVYESQIMAGYFASKMNKIVVKQPLPGAAFIGCFTLRDDAGHQLDIVQWGRVNPTQEISVIASSVEAFLRMELDQ